MKKFEILNFIKKDKLDTLRQEAFIRVQIKSHSHFFHSFIAKH